MTTAGTGPAATSRCPHFSPGERVGQIRDPGLGELSGLAAGRTNPEVLWVHEDSGNPADLVAVRPDGTVVHRFHLAGVTNRDWEDIAVGPGPDADAPASYVFLGDTGDNRADQPTFRIVRVREPEVPGGDAGARSDLAGAVVLTGRYPDGPHDAETLLADPRTGDLFVVTKSAKGSSGIYRWPSPRPSSSPTTLQAVGTIDIADLDGAIDRRLTAGDISPDGDEILLRTYTNAWLWRRGPGEAVTDALASIPCAVPLQIENQGEAIAWDASGSAYFTTSEGAAAPIIRFDRE